MPVAQHSFHNQNAFILKDGLIDVIVVLYVKDKFYGTLIPLKKLITVYHSLPLSDVMNVVKNKYPKYHHFHWKNQTINNERT